MPPSHSDLPTRKRFWVVALLFISVVVNYMDRLNIGVAAPGLRTEFGLDTIQMGLIFSAFGWTYALLQVPGGIMVDLFRTRGFYSVLVFMWSAATLAQGFVNSLFAMIGLRMTVGVFQAPSYPCNNKIVTSWFPDNERATAIAIYTSGQFLGLAVLSYGLAAIHEYFGWRGVFYATGGIGLLWAGVLYYFYRDPLDHPTVSEAEIEYIRAGGGHPEGTKKAEKTRSKFSWSDLGEAFKHRKLWGVFIGQYCLGGIFWFFLTWFPTYLSETRGIDGLKSGFLGAIPYLGAFVGVLLSGFVSDRLLKSGCSATLARKLPVLCGMAISGVVVLANYTDSTTMIITFMTIAFFGNGLASIAWVFISSIAPVRLIGMTGGVFNFIGNLSGATVPLIIGILAKDGDFAPALSLICGLSVIGFCSYLFLVGKVERIQIQDR